MDVSDKKEMLAPWVPLLLSWYQENARVLPWRLDSSFYHVWISEIMLQQTRVEAVKDYYMRFIKALPDIRSLSLVNDDDLLKLWEGLGYYSRAKNLKKCAIEIMETYDGIAPSSFSALCRLPGIGPYTAGAIASIVFHEPVPAVDGNVLRVMSRLFFDTSDITKAETKKMWFQRLQAILPYTNPSLFNQALMELGALVCIPNGNPLCEACPLNAFCMAYHHQKTNEVPVKSPKKARKIENYTILLLFDGKEIAIQKRSQKGLLGGLYEFPHLLGHVTPKEVISYVEERGMMVHHYEALDMTKHIFTHLEWHMIGYMMHVSRLDKKTDYLWITREELKRSYSLPTAFKTYQEYFLK